MLLLEQAVAHGARLIRDRVCGIKVTRGQVQTVLLADGREIETNIFVNAAGPFIKEVGRMLGVELPVFCEVHLKAAFNDHLGIVPREAPLMIWTDPQTLDWDQDERALLAGDEETSWLLGELPPGAHCRPEGGQDSPVVLILWEYHDQVIEPVWPPPLDPQYAEVVLRGLSAMLPGLEAYFSRLPRLSVDGGYYTKTSENLPLVSSLPVQGAYLVGALSGFGVMSAPAAGELLAAQIAGTQLPAYAPAFGLERYQDPGYLDKIAAQKDSGQL
jgi:glycine/D-amino acid oxidase-like deaminating enzyme